MWLKTHAYTSHDPLPLLAMSLMSKPVNNIWKDPNVMAALKEGRSADDIAVVACPKCNRWGYYNEGSHFSCRFCKVTFQVTQEDADTDRICRLSDTVTETTDGYYNQTI